ncbi:MAG: YdcF family protein [Verrucomicrobia bacterium]|nr:YdcF family protein [Verrucomicrobiota bacterium]
MLRTLIAALCDPLALVFLLLLTGLLWQKRRRSCLIVVCVLLLLFGYSPLPNALMRGLSQRYPPVGVVDAEVREIVLLASGGFTAHESHPINARMTQDGLARLMEAVRLHRNLPESRIWVSIPGVYTDIEINAILRDLAFLFQLPDHTLHPLSGARTTGDEARLAAKGIETNQPFYLVTSDFHQPRAMKTFEKAGLNPLPAPASIDRDSKPRSFSPSQLLPKSSALENTRRWLHEQVGMMGL